MSYYYDVFMEMTELGYKKFMDWIDGKYDDILKDYEKYKIWRPNNIFKMTTYSGETVYIMQWLSYNKFDLIYNDTFTWKLDDILEIILEHDKEDIDCTEDELYFCEVFDEEYNHETYGNGQCDFCLKHELDTDNMERIE